jgi:hypothetical protein
MAEDRHKRKGILSVNRPILSAARQKLSFRLEDFQPVSRLLFLVVTTPCCQSPGDGERASHRASFDGDGSSSHL